VAIICLWGLAKAILNHGVDVYLINERGKKNLSFGHVFSPNLFSIIFIIKKKSISPNKYLSTFFVRYNLFFLGKKFTYILKATT
jgi:hypothetical protein